MCYIISSLPYNLHLPIQTLGLEPMINRYVKDGLSSLQDDDADRLSIAKLVY